MAATYTYAELLIVTRTARDRVRIDHERDLQLARLGEQLARWKHIPTLDELMGREAKPPTAAQVAASVAAHADIVERLGHDPDNPDGVVVALFGDPAPEPPPTGPEAQKQPASGVTG